MRIDDRINGVEIAWPGWIRPPGHPGSRMWDRAGYVGQTLNSNLSLLEYDRWTLISGDCCL